MARAPDPRIEQAKAMYLQGAKLVEIASQLNLPANVRIRKANVRKKESVALSQGTRTVPAGHREIRKQLLRESLRLSFLIAWIRRSNA